MNGICSVLPMCVCMPVCVEEKSLFFLLLFSSLLAYSFARSFAFTFQVERIVFSLSHSLCFFLLPSFSTAASSSFFLVIHLFARFSLRRNQLSQLWLTHISIDTAERERAGYTALGNETNSCLVCLHAIITGEEVIRLIKRRKDGEKKTFSPDMKHRVGALSLSLENRNVRRTSR